MVSYKSFKDQGGRLAQIFEKIQDQDFGIIYKPGPENVVADTLSRIKTIYFSSELNWADEQKRDETLQHLISKANEGKEVKLSKTKLKIANNVLVTEQEPNRIIVPVHLAETIISSFHDEITGGHLSSEKTTSRIESRFWWPDLKQRVKRYCEACSVCQLFKESTTAKAPLKPIEASHPGQIIAIDFAGPFPTTKNNNNYIIVAIDLFSKWCEVRAVQDCSAETAARFIVEQVICHLGTPLNILSGQDVAFESILFKELCERFRIGKLRATAYHKEGNGQCER